MDLDMKTPEPPEVGVDDDALTEIASTAGVTTAKKKKKGLFGLKVPKALKSNHKSSRKSVMGDLTNERVDIDDLDAEMLDGPAAAAFEHVRELEQTIRNLEEEREALQVILSQKDLTIQQLSDEVAQFENTLQGKSDLPSPTRAGKLNDLVAKLAMAEKQLENCLREKTALEHQLDILKEAAAEKEQLLAEAKATLSELTDTFAEEKQRMMAEMTTLREQLEAEKSRPPPVADASDSSAQRIRELEMLLKQKDKALTEKAEEAAATHERLERQRSMLEKAEQQIAEQKQRLTVADETRVDKKSTDAAAAKLETDLTFLQEQLKFKDQQLTRLKTIWTTCLDGYTRLTETNNDAKLLAKDAELPEELREASNAFTRLLADKLDATRAKEAELTHIQERLTASETKLNEREAELSTRESSIASQEEALRELTSALAEKEQSLQAQVVVMETEWNQRKAQLEADADRLRQMEEDLAGQRQELEDRRQALNVSQATVDAAKSSLEAEKTSVAQLQSSLENDARALRDAMSTKESEILRKEAALQELETALRRSEDDMQSSIESQHTALSARETEVIRLRAEVEARDAELLDMKQRLSEQERKLEETARSQETRLTARETEIAALEAKLTQDRQRFVDQQSALENERAEWMQQAETLAESRLKLEAEAKELADRQAAYEAEQSAREAALDEKTKKLDALERDLACRDVAVDELERRFAEAQNELEERKAALASQAQELMAEKQALTREHVALESERSQIEQDSQECRQQQQELLKVLRSTGSLLRSTESELNTPTEHDDAPVADFSALMGSLQRKQAMLNEKEIDLQRREMDFQHALEAREAAIELREAELKAREAEVAELQRHIDLFQSKLNERADDLTQVQQALLAQEESVKKMREMTDEKAQTIKRKEEELEAKDQALLDQSFILKEEASALKLGRSDLEAREQAVAERERLANELAWKNERDDNSNASVVGSFHPLRRMNTSSVAEDRLASTARRHKSRLTRKHSTYDGHRTVRRVVPAHLRFDEPTDEETAVSGTNSLVQHDDDSAQDMGSNQETSAAMTAITASHVTELEQHVKLLEEQLADLSQKHAAALTQTQAFADDLEINNAEIVSYRKRIEQLDKENEERLDEVKAFVECLLRIAGAEQATSNNDELREQALATAEKSLTEIRTLRLQVGELQKEKDEMVVELMRSKEGEENLTTRLEAMKESLESLKGQLTEKTMQADRLAQTADDLEARVTAAETAAEVARATGAAEKDATTVQMRVDLQLRENEVRAQRKEIESLRASLEKANAELLTGRERISKLELEIIEIRSQEKITNVECGLRIQEKERELAAKQKEIQELTDRIADLNATMKRSTDDLHARLSAAENAADVANVATQNTEDMLIQVNEKLNATEHTIAKLRAELQTAEEARSNLDRQSQSDTRKVTTLEGQVKALKVSLQEAYQREQNLQEELNTMRRRRRESPSNPSEENGSSSSPSGAIRAPQAPPPAVVFSNVIASVGPENCALVSSPDGAHEVVWCLKQRLVESLFEAMPGMGRTAYTSNVFDPAAPQASLGAIEGRVEVMRVLQRVRSLWKLGEDLRLALVQGDPTLASAYQDTTTTHADWESTLATLRGSAELIEKRNAELERLAAGYSKALQEARQVAKADRERAKNIVTSMKQKLETLQEGRVQLQTERDHLLTEMKKLESQIQYLTSKAIGAAAVSVLPPSARRV